MALNLARWAARIGLGEHLGPPRPCDGGSSPSLDGSPARRAASPSIYPGAGPGVSRSVAPWPDCEPFHSQPDGGRLQPARQPHPLATPTSPKTRARPASERLSCPAVSGSTRPPQTVH